MYWAGSESHWELKHEAASGRGPSVSFFRLKCLCDGDSLCSARQVLFSSLQQLLFPPLSFLVVSASSVFPLAFGHHCLVSSLPHDVSSLTPIKDGLSFYPSSHSLEKTAWINSMNALGSFTAVARLRQIRRSIWASWTLRSVTARCTLLISHRSGGSGRLEVGRGHKPGLRAPTSSL